MVDLTPAGDTAHLDGTVHHIGENVMDPIPIETFDDGNLDEYTNRDSYNLISSAQYADGYAVELGVNVNQQSTPLASVTGHRIYPRIGDSFAVRWHLGDPANHADTGSSLGGTFNFEFGMQSASSLEYRFVGDFDTGSVILKNANASPSTTLGEDTSVSWSPDTWYETRIEWLASGVLVIEVVVAGTDTRVARFDTSGASGLESVGGGIGMSMGSLEQAVTVDVVELRDRDGWPAHPVDGFEDGELSDYSRIDSTWSATADAALTGRYGAVAADDGAGGHAISMPGQGLQAYPKAGETTRVDFRFETSGGYFSFLLGTQDTTGGTEYEVRFHQVFGQILVVLDNGPTDVLNSVETQFEPGVTYRAEIEWTTGGVFDVTVENRDTGDYHASVETSNSPDETFTEGGYGIFASPSASVSVDTVELIGKDALLDESPDVVYETIDSFEDGDMDEYVTYKAGSGEFAATASPNAVDGDNICEIWNGVNGYGAIDVTNSLSGLPIYPERGDTFGFYVGSKYNSTKASVTWAIQEDRNAYPYGYHLWIDGRDDTLELLKYDDAHDQVSIASASFDATAWNNGEMCHVEIEFGSPTITATLRDSNDNQIQQISGDDSELDSGGLGFGMEKGTESDTTSEVYFDYFYRVADQS